VKDRKVRSNGVLTLGLINALNTRLGRLRNVQDELRPTSVVQYFLAGW
jgi:hypothetical protein